MCQNIFVKNRLASYYYVKIPFHSHFLCHLKLHFIKLLHNVYYFLSLSPYHSPTIYRYESQFTNHIEPGLVRVQGGPNIFSLDFFNSNLIKRN